MLKHFTEYGKFAEVSLPRFCLFLLFSILTSLVQARMGKVASEGGTVYTQPNFDSQVMATADPEMELEMSTRKFETNMGSFYRVRLPGGKTGFIADNEITPLKVLKSDLSKNLTAQAKARKEGLTNSQKTKNKKLSEFTDPEEEFESLEKFPLSRYIGVSTSRIGYRESTMGLTPTEQVSFFGLRMSGSNVLVSGQIPSEFQIQYFGKAPSYYEQATGNPASGLLLLTDFSLLSQTPLHKSIFTYFGYGVLVKYSNFRVRLNGANYTLEDMNLGLKFQLGAAFKIGFLALRSDIQYYWEKSTYLGYGLSVQIPF